MSRADPALLGADLTTQLDLLARGEVSSVELVGQQLAAIAGSQPALNAFIHIDADGALAAAATADARRHRGEAGPLDGVGIAVKDNIDVVGMVSTAGMQTLRQAPAAQADNPAVAALRGAGAVILGKLNMHEAALGADNDNPHFGACHNPHRPGFTPGGSSGGSGAAVAAGLCSAALGTDTMGSVRIPAAYCGVVGLKPTWGMISTRGTVPLCRRLDHVGPLARSARDLTILLPLLAGFDPASAQSRAIPLAAATTGRLQLGVVDLAGAVELETAVARAFDDGLRILAGLGHAPVALPSPSVGAGQARRAGLLLCEAELLVEHAESWRNQRQAFSPMLAGLMGWAEDKSAADLVAASLQVDAGAVELQQWLAACDVVVMPTTPQRAFAFAAGAPASQADLTAFANMAGVPALSVPLPVGEGELPVGLQLIGRSGAELQLIALAEAFQHASGWQPALPSACTQWWPT